MTDLTEALRSSFVGVFMRDNPDLFPAMEMAHFVGLSILMGAMIVIDLRILGALTNVSYRASFKLIPVAIAGFLINLISGVAFICTNPALYLTNWAFWLKMGLVVLGGLNALWFTFAEHGKLSALPDDARAPAVARFMAFASLLFWVLVLLLGRLLPTFASVAGG